jgi:tRNA dimethylallyltransferase
MTTYHRQQQQAKQSSEDVFPYDVVQMAIAPVERSVLHRRIEKRFLQMIEQGFIEEVRALHQRGDLHINLPSMRSVGYRQVWQFIEGELDHAQMLERGIIATRQLAKRQFTWLNGWTDLQWLQTDDDVRLLATGKNMRQISALEGRPVLELALKYLCRFAS